MILIANEKYQSGNSKFPEQKFREITIRCHNFSALMHAPKRVRETLIGVNGLVYKNIQNCRCFIIVLHA